MTVAKICRRVLIVEDEGMVAMLLEEMLTDLGHEVVAIVGRVDRAVELAFEAAVDVAVLDVNLNGQQIYPVATALKSRGVPFVFATGYDNSGLNEEWRSVPTLQKPFQARDLERVMREVFDGHAA
ncbi:MAG: response regulator [Methylocella sp.]